MVDARRTRLILALLGALVLLSVPSALAQSLYERQQDVQTRMSGLRAEIEAAEAREGVLTTEIRAASERIGALTGDIDGLTALITELEAEIAVRRARLARLEARFEEQTRDLEHLRRQYELAQLQLESRLVQLYQSDETDSFGVLLQVQSLGDLLDQLEYFDSVGRQDQAITTEIEELKVEMRVAREETKLTQDEVAEATAALEEKNAEHLAARQALVAQQEALASARAAKEGVLAGVRDDRAQAMENLEALEAASAQLAAQIRASQSGGGGSSGSGTSSSGFIWPVNGVITSGFGPRWGRMHSGIDISAPCGTPIRAVASGNVIVSGWMGGYGYLTVIDHGNGLATAYAHQSAIYASGRVGQGETIGAVGSTGYSTGCHLHFEVRVNGTAVDPMGYL